jgi:hypothetical protein
MPVSRFLEAPWLAGERSSAGATREAGAIGNVWPSAANATNAGGHRQ